MRNKILFITAFAPSRIGAGENHSRILLNRLSESNEIDLIYFKYEDNPFYTPEADNIRVLRCFKNSTFIKMMNVLCYPLIFPLFSVRFNFFRLKYIRRTIKEVKYDYVIFDFSQTFLYARYIKHDAIILNIHDVIIQRYSRIYGGLFTGLVNLSEKFVLKNPKAKLFTHSEKDSHLLTTIYNLSAVPTNVLLDDDVLSSEPSGIEDYFIFFANWGRPDNSNGLKWFFEKVYPFISDTRIKIIGSALPEDIRKNLGQFEKVEYLGFVLNPYPVISNARGLISPLFTGAGIKVKVVEALACGTKAIGTPVSFEGIPVQYNQYMVNATDENDFIDSIRNFHTDINEKIVLKKSFIKSYNNSEILKCINSR